MRKCVVVLILLFVLFLSACKKEDINMTLEAGQDTVEINSEWNDSGAFLKVGNKRYQAESYGVVDTSTLGLYRIEYRYKYKGVTYHIYRYVQVVDQTKPVILLNPGIDTVKQGGTWVDAGATVSDNSNEEIVIYVSGVVDTNMVGTYEIVYTASDSSGNTAMVIRYVNIV